MKRIIYYDNCWFTNVGEAFIDIGSLQLLKKIFPNEAIACVSNMTNFYYNEITENRSNPLFNYEENSHIVSDYFFCYDCDYIVLSGMFACSSYLKAEGAGRRIVDYYVKRGAKVIFLGLGGALYSKEEVNEFSEYLKDIKPELVMTRDLITYENYKNCCKCIPGIDCAFWIKESFNPKGFQKKEYDIFAFNRSNEPQDLDNNNIQIVRPWHMQYYLKEEKCKKGLMVSDSPYDYLTLYANARMVYTDLVHATIISLMYGTPVKYWYIDKRSSAFDAINGLVHQNGWLSVSSADLNKQKKEIEEEIKRHFFEIKNE